MKINSCRVNTYTELQEELFLDSYDDKIKRHRPTFLYRGISDSKHDLKHSLHRTVNDRLDLESGLIRNFQKYASTQLKNEYGFWDVLSIAQHHGLPTRLLDWTFSPYVALHFTTDNLSKYNSDGVIWQVDYNKIHSYLPKILYQELVDHKSTIFTTDILNNLKIDTKQMMDLELLEKQNGSDDKSYFLFFEPPSIDDRIINQYACFSVASRPELIFNHWMEKHPETYKAIIIPKELKLEIRDKLDMINLNERVIFPGLDGLCKWLSRHYTPTDRIYR
ncbi:FRG domain-containing protein [Mobilitalea sibirica]|uniref:FRG domain-containing protein n=1 Tax=Mobilitalea sibirica TaxID=1462919 RepID=A0A8J7KTV3_9FIRM|nr:FRG domain-containing protein [Mobilitalea sibirica]MBH1941781.1 FRG domain-containing protein [Mobilitalea sibirica]